MKQIIPREGFVVLRNGAEDYKLDNGLIITAATQMNYALIPCRVNNMGYDKPIIFKTAYGDEKMLNNDALVLIEKGSGTKLVVDNKEYIMIEVSKIIAFVNEK